MGSGFIGLYKIDIKGLFKHNNEEILLFWHFQKVRIDAATLVPDEVSLLWPAEATGRCLPL